MSNNLDVAVDHINQWIKKYKVAKICLSCHQNTRFLDDAQRNELLLYFPGSKIELFKSKYYLIFHD